MPTQNKLNESDWIIKKREVVIMPSIDKSILPYCYKAEHMHGVTSCEEMKCKLRKGCNFKNNHFIGSKDMHATIDCEDINIGY